MQLSTGKLKIDICHIDINDNKVRFRLETKEMNDIVESACEKIVEDLSADLPDETVLWMKYSWISSDFSEGSGDILYNALFDQANPQEII